MQFPTLQPHATTTSASDKRSDPLEQPTLLSLEFPSLASGTSQKRAAHHHASLFPAKRHKGVSSSVDQRASVKEDNSWIDNFALLDSFYLEDSDQPSSFTVTTNHHQQQQAPSVTDIIKKALNCTCEDVLIPSIPQGFSFNNNGYDDSQIQTSISQADMSQPIRIDQSQNHLPETVQSAPYTMVTPSLDPTESVSQQIPPLAMPQQAPVMDSSFFTISKLKNSKEPTLLTLTSYPFRVVYSNQAFSKMSGRKTSVVGDSVFDTFNLEGSHLRPCLATYPTLTGRLENEIALVPSFTDDQNNQFSLRCNVQAYPVTKRNDSNAVRYFAVRFSPMQAPL